MRSFWRYLSGTICVSLGVLLLAASGFLAYWEYAAHGERDIVARGGILLFMLLPWVISVSWVIVAGLIARPLRRSGVGWWGVIGISLAALLVSAALEFLPPIFLPARVLSLLPGSVRPVADFALASVLVAAGLLVVGRGLPNRPPNESLHRTSARETSM